MNSSPRRRSLRPSPPDRQAETYLRRVRPYLTDLHRRTESILERAARIAGLVMDSDDTGRGARAVDEVEREMAEAWPWTRLAGIVRPVGTETVKLGERNAARLTGLDAKDVASPALVSDWVGVNVDLIRTVEDRYLQQVRDLVSEGFESGGRWEDISKDLQERAGVSESNAERIARDQTAKLNAEVSQDVMTQLGVTRAIWRTMSDERVRDEHAHLEGVEYNIEAGINEGGETIWPGSPIQCRCYAEPVLDFSETAKPEEAEPTEPVEPVVVEPKPATEPVVEPVQPVKPEEFWSNQKLRDIWGKQLDLRAPESPNQVTIDLQAIAEASPKIIGKLSDLGAKIHVDLGVNSAAEIIKRTDPTSPIIESLKEGELKRFEPIAGVVYGKRNLVVSGGTHGTESLMAHEMGHLVDFNLQRGGQLKITETRDWRDAWEQFRISDIPIAKVDYYSNAESGHMEAFAEVYGHTITRGMNSASKTWGRDIVDRMAITLRGLDPSIKIPE